jgi:hypothetical protein
VVWANCRREFTTSPALGITEKQTKARLCVNGTPQLRECVPRKTRTIHNFGRLGNYENKIDFHAPAASNAMVADKIARALLRFMCDKLVGILPRLST